MEDETGELFLKELGLINSRLTPPGTPRSGGKPAGACDSSEQLALFLISVLRESRFRGKHPAVSEFFYAEHCEVDSISGVSKVDGISGVDGAGGIGRRPKAFHNQDQLERVELASLPLYYIHALAKHDSIDVRHCLTKFEFADCILAHQLGDKSARDLSFYDKNVGEGFMAFNDVQEMLLKKLSETKEKTEANISSTVVAIATVSQFGRSGTGTINSQVNGNKPLTPSMKLAMAAKSKPAPPVPSKVLPARLEPVTLPLTVEKFFEIHGMTKYTAAFLALGFDDMRVVSCLSEKELGVGIIYIYIYIYIYI